LDSSGFHVPRATQVRAYSGLVMLVATGLAPSIGCNIQLLRLAAPTLVSQNPVFTVTKLVDTSHQ
ncbi:hypothetical protein A2U01_0065922, partial [Trifolium medium]|nr:hypothetical protein [Trifolium medium]